MAFTDKEKIKALEDELIHSIQKGRDWAEFKAEFFDCSVNLKDGTMDNIDKAIDVAEEELAEAQNRLTNLQDLKQELSE